MRDRKSTAVMLAVIAATAPALASSHREAPAITQAPKVDATDFYMFRSYEGGRDGFVTFVANYLPLQDPYGGPNYFSLDPEALYDIKVDNNGDAVEDLTFRFRFQERNRRIALDIGPEGAKKSVEIPLIVGGPIGAGDSSSLNRNESYTVELIRGALRPGVPQTGDRLRNSATGEATFVKPVDNIGLKTIADYEAYAAQYVYDVRIPGCGDGRLFVGQRKDPFVVNLGETFDLVNFNPLGPVNGASDTLCDKNVTSLELEVPVACVASPQGPTIGAWTAASLPIQRGLPRGPQTAGTLSPRSSPASTGRPDVPAYAQVSRLSAPLVNELVIGLGDKDNFNRSEPRGDAQFIDYVTHPTLPAVLQLLFGVQAPTLFPRADLIAAFLTGIDGLNKTATPAEMLRLNTSIAPKAAGEQSSLGALGGDLAGFPNGRRPGDDVVDIELRVAMGALLDASVAPAGQLPYTDGAYVDASYFDSAFPYLRTPVPGSPNSASEGSCD